MKCLDPHTHMKLIRTCSVDAEELDCTEEVSFAIDAAGFLAPIPVCLSLSLTQVTGPTA